MEKLVFWDFRKRTTVIVNSEKFDNAAEFWETKSYMSLLEKHHCISKSKTTICVFYKWTYKHSTCSFSWFLLELHSNSIVPQKHFIVCSKIPCMKLLYQIETGHFICIADYFGKTKFHDFLIFWNCKIFDFVAFAKIPAKKFSSSDLEVISGEKYFFLQKLIIIVYVLINIFLIKLISYHCTPWTNRERRNIYEK